MGIKEAEEATGISRQNIRFYERQGLLRILREIKIILTENIQKKIS